MGFDIKKLGDRITSAPEAQVVANPAPQQTLAPIEIDRWFRNGQHPNATAMNLINQSANSAALYRGKEVFRAASSFYNEVSSLALGDRFRWPFAFHTGPYTHALMCVVVMQPQDVLYDVSTYARLDLSTSATLSPVAASASFVHGLSPLGTNEARGWQYLKECWGFIDNVSPDTDYYGTFYDVDGGRIKSATVFELCSLTENFDGYLAQNMTTHTPILDVHRQNQVTVSNDLWRKGGSHLFNWIASDGTTLATLGRQSSSATNTNVVDGSSTAVSGATPGYTLDLRNHDRLSQSSGVPVVFKAYGSTTGATGGTVVIKDSGGTVLGTIGASAWTAAGGASWKSTTLNLPATLAKYDVQFNRGAAGTFTLWGASFYEKD